MIFKILSFLCFLSIIGLYFYFRKKKQVQKYKFVLPIVFFIFLLSGVAIANFIESKTIQQLVVACFLLISNVVTFFVTTKATAVDRALAFIHTHINLIAILPFIASIILSALFFSSFRGDENIDKYEDTNGDTNYSLQSIGTNMITSIQNKSFAIQATNSTEGKSSGMTSYQRCDYDEINYTSPEYHGVKIIQATKTSSDEIEFNVDNVVSKGNCQISLVVDGTIIHNFDLNKNSTYCLKNANGKEAFIVLAGECADIKLSVVRR